MTFRFPKLPWKFIGAAGFGLVVVVLAATAQTWWPRFSNWVDQTLANYDASATDEAEHAAHAEHADAGESLVLSRSAQLNLGLTDDYLRPVALQPYYQSLTVPAVITGRPGRTQLHVSTPMTGIITHVHAVTGETIQPGDLLFEIRITHEDLVDVQTRFLETLEELDVEKAEIEWLEGVATTFEGSLLRDRIYKRDQLYARQLALGEALKLHGLSDRQVDWIAEHRRLLDTLQVVAPSIDTHPQDEELRLSQLTVVPVSLEDDGSLAEIDPHADEHANAPLLIESLKVHKGETVMAGAELCVLADYRELYVEGQAFERDTAAVLSAVEQNWTFTAVFNDTVGGTTSRDLELAYVSNLIDPATRVLPFYLVLENEIVVDSRAEEEDHDHAAEGESASADDAAGAAEGHVHRQRFITWRFRPGQRLQVRVPLVELQNQIVVPIEAVAEDGGDYFVFRRNGRERFDRIPVHITHRDNEFAVIAQDGAIFPGDVIALRGAHEMQMVIQNKSGGGVDPHAGHSHG